MDSKHFSNFMGSITDLERIVEKDRIFVTAALEAQFQHDADSSLIRIGESCQIAGARIAATSEVHAAKIAADMKVSCSIMTTLATKAVEIIISRRNVITGTPSDIAQEITEFSSQASDTISQFAKTALATIKADSEAAIRQIKDNSDEAIRQVEELVREIDHEIVENAQVAETRLAALAEKIPDLQEIASQAEDSVELIRDQFTKFSDRLQAVVTAFGGDSDLFVEKAMAKVSAASEAASARISETRDEAVNKIRTASTQTL